MPNMPPGSGASRREALRKILLISAAAGVVLLGGTELLNSISKSKSQTNPKAKQIGTTADQSQKISNTSSASTSSTMAVTNDSPTFVDGPGNYTIKVAYFGFETIQTTGVAEEYLALPAPVFLQDVLSKIEGEHVVLAAMLPLMGITINGLPTYGNPQLENNSEVDFIPIYAGG
jgi:hypothetical protein